MYPVNTSTFRMVRKRQPRAKMRVVALNRAYEQWLNELRVKYREVIGQGVDFLVDDQQGVNIEDLARPADVVRLRELEALSLQQMTEAIRRG